jgi:glycosyltransferase involved in cell wall biosynthesis
MKRVLLITDVNFWEKSSGNRARIYSLIAYLSEYVALTVVNTGPAPRQIETILKEQFKADFYVLEKNKYLSSDGYGRRLKKLLKDQQFDSVIIEYIHSSYFLNFLEFDAQIVLDAHDIVSDRSDDFKKFNQQGALYEIGREDEIEVFNVYDYVMAICKPDYDRISTFVGNEKTLLCPHPALLHQPEIKDQVKNIVFVASAYLPNKDGIEWFVANCWPLIYQAYDVQLVIYGTVCSVIDVSYQDGVVCRGFVAEIDQIYRDADLIINPVRFGAGLKIKNVEALAHGLPLVTTSHGARGLESASGSAFLVADDQQTMTESIAHVIADRSFRLKLSKNAGRYIADLFSPEQCFLPLLNAINRCTIQ